MLEVASTADDKFDAKIGLGSPSYGHVTDVAHKRVEWYLKNVALIQRKSDPYVVGPILGHDDDVALFTHALHEGYDALNPHRARVRARSRSCWAHLVP